MLWDTYLPPSSPLPTFTWTNTKSALPAVRQTCTYRWFRDGMWVEG